MANVIKGLMSGIGIALLLQCMLLAPGLAANGDQLVPQKAPLLPPGFGTGDSQAQKCLASLQGASGCLQEIIASFLSLQIKLVGPECCKVVVQVEDSCWPKLFPSDPFFAPLLKSFCKNVLAPPAANKN